MVALWAVLVGCAPGEVTLGDDVLEVSVAWEDPDVNDDEYPDLDDAHTPIENSTKDTVRMASLRDITEEGLTISFSTEDATGEIPAETGAVLRVGVSADTLLNAPDVDTLTHSYDIEICVDPGDFGDPCEELMTTLPITLLVNVRR